MMETATNVPTFQTIANDPIKVQMYTLSNGLRLFLSVNSNEARIFTNIAVRAGSKQDPADTTGLAHYMEHMLFKGTSKIGTTDWEKESALLNQISDLYEQHRVETDAEKRLALYKKIDALSFEAAKFAAPSEYDKLASAIGAKATNAYTWLEQTVFVNDIPSNELERWMKLESERFRMMSLRLFHTELETVYEEFNISQDRDFRKANNAIRNALFPNHPYGTQTTLGSAQHLKSPSQVKIQEYFKTYYVPNNMAIIMAGDFDPSQVIKLAEKYFGTYQAQPLPPFTFEEQPRINEPIYTEVFGQEADYVDIAWRFGGSQTDDPFYLAILRGILYNRQAGLFDLNLNQRQRVLESEAWAWFYEDYSVLGLYGKGREGQSLDEVKDLLLAEVTKLKNGTFEDWLPDALIKDFKLDEIKAYESNQGRVNALTYAFILGMDWSGFVNRLDWLKQLTKQDIVDFINERLGDNYVVCYKRKGEDPNVIKVEKPAITPVELRRDAHSEFAKAFLSEQAPSLQPRFIDFDQFIKSQKLAKGLDFDYVKNKDNELFRLDYIFEMGKNSDRELAIALLYLPYLGTESQSAAAIQQAFFRLGLQFEAYADDDRSYLSLSGLEESLEEGIRLIEQILTQVKGDQAILDNVISDILIKRANSKQDKNFVLRHGMTSYARYGTLSPFTYRLSEQRLHNLRPEELTSRIKGLTSYEHRIYYYGQRPKEEVRSLLEKYHVKNSNLKPGLPNKNFPQLPTDKNQVLFVHFPMVQVELYLVSKGTPNFNLEEYLTHELYNEYFGYGLSSIVFQEIRESKALAYSTFAMYTSPAKKDQAHYLNAFVGTQPDKITDALTALLDIIENMPVSEIQIEHARQSILKRMESEWLPPSRVYWEYRSMLDKGYSHDLNKDLYEKMKVISADDLKTFHQQKVKGRAFTILVMGDRANVDMNYLQSLGKVQELSLEEVFGF